MEIRKGTESDRASILALIRMYPEQLVQDHLPEPEEFFVAEENGEVVACCALEIYSPKIAEVRSLAVKKEFSGKGIASALVQKCVATAKEQRVRQVLAITGAVDFFDKLGFKAFNGEKFALFKIFED